ncbi:Gfo/Idh/MocA family oxidoreductase [Candidatus Poribacteria bacterium]|nr:Gfo/Idh/MocA family oxidoreductase [Candidatus Poribacteria bacterium]MBT5535227.1 Gfo/Idh/MocA family oxidoreductase [Candidatus Poribacteria bacterium]MBT5715166.1 Gfo/Idh/MocA family oxidoreductase [Candidatus Poribacteria bacterium]MBT7100205.1 Gfo/Idh/MocA family oxidoreductase [Candidatus Poribacteria bacterium]MBT7807373.1 Gfo/Idh/MocA family oxidoreductase [Candidatus Poribacteria bacterium]
MTQDRDYRLALIGSGSRGMHLWDVANRASRCRVVCAADLGGVNFDRLRDDGVAVYDDFAEMLRTETVDIAIVATPISTHYSVARRVLDFPLAGVYLEKSMATRLSEADELLTVAAGNDTRFVVGHQLRYARGWADARGMIDDDMIGDIHVIRARRGAALLTHHTHQTDLMRYYLDDCPASWVIGQAHREGSHLSEGMESEAQSLGYVQFENGVSGIIESGKYGDSPGNYITIVGEKGEIRVGTDARFRSEDTAGKWEPIPEYAHPNIFDELIAWIEDGPRHRCAAESGRDTLELLLAIYESSRARGRVELPLARRGNALEEMLAEGVMS